MGNEELALPLHKEALEDRWRVLGSQHPETLISVLSPSTSLGDTGNLAAAIPLLHGFTVAYGPEHPYARRSQSTLHDNEQRLVNSQASADHLRTIRLRRQ